MIDKNIIENLIVPHLSKGKCGKESELNICEVVEAIFYRLKTGCQWRQLPIKQFISRAGETKWQSIYHYFSKWCKDGSWENVWIELVSKYKEYLDMSCLNLDGSHTRSLQGGESIGYQGRKKYRSTNMLFLIDNQGVILFCSQPIPGNHNDLYMIKKHFKSMLEMATKTGIAIKGLFLNADAGFDSEDFRRYLEGENIFANIAFNKRRNQVNKTDSYYDEQLYKRRSFCEHSFAWMDAYKALLVRYEKLASHWFAINIMGMMHIFLLKIKHI